MVTFNTQGYAKFVKGYVEQAKNTQGYYSQLATGGQSIDFLSEFNIEPTDEVGRDLPFFSTGSEFANILSYEFDVPKGLFLTLANRKLGSDTELFAQYKEDPDSVIEMFVSKFAEYYSKSGIIFSEKNEKVFYEDIRKALDSFIKDGPGMVISGDDSGTLSTFYYLNMVREMGGFFDGSGSATGVRGVITTIPMFHLADTMDLGQSCIISIRNNPRPYQHLDFAVLSEAFYSGVYKILSIKHVVDGQKPHSVFEVVKIAPLVFDKKLDYKL